MHIRLLDLRRHTLHPAPAAPVLAAFRERQQAQTRQTHCLVHAPQAEAIGDESDPLDLPIKLPW